MKPIPIVLVGESYWKQLINFDLMVEEGYIAPEDAKLFSYVETAEEIVTTLERFYIAHSDKLNHPGQYPL